MIMHRLAFHLFTRRLLRGLVAIVRPLRFTLGISQRVSRPLCVLLSL